MFVESGGMAKGYGSFSWSQKGEYNTADAPMDKTSGAMTQDWKYDPPAITQQYAVSTNGTNR